MTHDSTRDLKSLQELPLLPHTFDRIMRLLDDPRNREHKLAEAVAQDPALTLKVLRLANSPYYGASGQVTGLDQALGLIGSTSVRGLLLSLHLLQSHLESVRPQLERLAQHGYATAQAARVIARMQRRPQVSLIVSAALLHDLGYLCRLQAYPDVADAAEWEQRLAREEAESGQTHQEWGYACALAWNLPEEIGDTIRHYRSPSADSPHHWLQAVIHAGDVICRERGLSPLASYGELDTGVASFLGLNAEQLVQIESETRLVLQQTGWLPGTSSLLEQIKK